MIVRHRRIIGLLQWIPMTVPVRDSRHMLIGAVIARLGFSGGEGKIIRIDRPSAQQFHLNSASGPSIRARYLAGDGQNDSIIFYNP